MSVELATCINLYRGSIDPAPFMSMVNKELNNEWSEIHWKHSLIGEGAVNKHRTSAEADISFLNNSDSALAKAFKPISETIVNDLVKDYTKEYWVHTNNYEGWRLLKYSVGGEYHAHHDHSPQNQRIVSVVAFLETPTEGGSLEFPFFGVEVDAIAGDVVIFPSNFPYLHIAHPVTAGVKCSLVTWFQ